MDHGRRFPNKMAVVAELQVRRTQAKVGFGRRQREATGLPVLPTRVLEPLCGSGFWPR